jgi:hypothetical protein
VISAPIIAPCFDLNVVLDRGAARDTRQIVTERTGALEVHVMQLVAGSLRVAVHEDPDAHGLPAVDRELAGTQQRDVAEPDATSGGGRELRRQVVGSGEDDADEVVVLELVAGEDLLHQALGLLLDLLLGVLVARDRAAQRPKPHTIKD